MSEDWYFSFFEGYYNGQEKMNANITGRIDDIKSCLNYDAELARGYKGMLAANLTKLMISFDLADLSITK